MMGQTCNDIPGSRLTIALCYVPCFASSCSCVVGSISTTANCLRRRNPHQAVKNKDRNYTRSSLREFIPDADERPNYYLDRLDRRNAVGYCIKALKAVERLGSLEPTYTGNQSSLSWRLALSFS
jgi:hypothetical protein